MSAIYMEDPIEFMCNTWHGEPGFAQLHKAHTDEWDC
jgi:hypothetical protein